jgi:multiple sugar transport system permease protein
MTLRNEPRPAFKLLVHVLCYAAAFSMLVPFLWMVSASLKTNEEIFVWPPRLLPATPVFGNYAMAWEKARIGRFFANSLLVSTVVTCVSLFFNALAGFAFAKLKFPGRDRIFFALLMTMMLPAQVSVIFAYLLMVRLGYAGTYQSLILPGLAGAFGIFYMRQSVAPVPNDLVDAGRIDGLTDFEIFLHIVLPLIRPALAALAIFTFVGSWNAFFWPLIMVDKPELKTLPLAVADLSSGQVVQSWPVLMAAATMVVMPMILVFLVFQRQFVRGITMTGMRD